MHYLIQSLLFALLVAASAPSQESPRGDRDAALAKLRPLLFEVEDGYATWDPATRESALLIPEFTRSVSLPVWSPDGKQVAFVAFHGGLRQIMICDRDGERRVLGGGEAEHITELAWAPDGKHIAYEVMSHVVGEGWVSIIDMEGKVNRVTVAGAHDSGICWSSDGQRLAIAATKKQDVIEGGSTLFVEKQQEVEIYDLRTAERTPVTTDFLAHIYDISWSPDDRWIAVKCDGGLMVVEAGGGKPRRVARAISNSHPPRWSPSGQWMLVHRHRPDKPRDKDGEVLPKKPDELLLVDVAGNARQLHTFAGHYYDYDWSPDGQWVAAVQGDLALVLIHVRSGDQRVLGGKADYWSCVRWASPR